MPPTRTQSSQKSTEQEIRILLAIKVLENNEITTLREAVKRFNVPYTTLQPRLNGSVFRLTARANNHKLT